jgi:hypothetical protein
MNKIHPIAKKMLLFVATGLISFSAGATTVCSMTLNSPDELNVIKKNLGTAGYDYVELGATPDAFCGRNVQCDIFVVSAHFGGNFFGIQDGKQLEISLEKVEEFSCSAKCGNLFAHAKQVYLFGCNTLNGKVRDQRTPEEYVNVLRRDRYGLNQAQHLAANIYSPLGGTYHQRMQQVFPNASQIFGFYSLAPVGPNIRKDLDVAFSKFHSTPPERWAESITADLKRYSFTSTVGKSQADSLACKILSKRYETEKLRVIREAFDRGEGLKIVSMLVSFFRVLSVEHLDSGSEGELAKIRANKAAREELLSFIMTSSEAFAAVRLELLDMMQKIGWMSKPQAVSIATEISLRLLPKAFIDPGYVSLLHPAVNIAKFNYQALPLEYWNHLEMYQVVENFIANDTVVADRAVETIRSSQDKRLILAAGNTLLRMIVWVNIPSQARTAAKILASSSDPQLRSLGQQLAQKQQGSETHEN